MKKLLLTALVASSLVGCAQTTRKEYVSVVTMDVNPSIQLQLNQQDDVVQVIASNTDAQKVVGDMDLEGAKVDVAMHAIVGSMVKEGYLNDKQNTVLLSITHNDITHKERLEKELSDEISSLLSTYQISGAIVSQDVQTNTTLEDMVSTYDISLSKAALVQEVKQKKESYKVEDLVKLSTQDLILLNDKPTLQGEVSKQQYITKDEALTIALNNAKLSKNDIRELDIEFDYDRNRLTYEIDFEANGFEYEYEIDAENKTILREIEPEDDVKKPLSNKSTTQTKKVSNIGKEKALSIALKNAGSSSKEAKQVKVEFDKEDKKYEVEFNVGRKEYSYDIHATSGKILEKDVEMDD